jgi:hypothetical protein
MLDNLFILATSVIEQNRLGRQPQPITSTTANATAAADQALLMGQHGPAQVKMPACAADGSSNIQCVTVPTNQSTTISQTQVNSSVISKVNNGGNTFITLRQN